MKQLVEPESTSALKETFGTDSEVKGTINELDKERTEEHNEDALILASLSALAESTRSPVSAGIEESWTNFLLTWPKIQWPQRGLSWLGDIHGPCDWIGHREGRGLCPCVIDVRSCGVSLPSLPSLLVKLSFFSVTGLVILPEFCFGVAGGFGVPLVVKPEAVD